MDEWQELERRARESFGLELPPEALAKLRTFVVELLRWAPKANLVSASSPGEVVSRHVLDSLAAARLLPGGGAVADVGSGAGFPGIPLAVCRPGPFVLIESRQRRVSFLRHAVRTLELRGVEVFEGRAEDFDSPLAAVVSRAVRPEIAVAIGRRLLASGGRVLVYEKQDAPALVAEGFHAAGGIDYELPDGLRHRVTVLERRFT